MAEFRDFCEHTLLRRALWQGLIVLDLGTNRGVFSRALSACYPGEYHAVEPNPDLVTLLQGRRPFASVRHAAVVDRTGPIELRLARNDEGSSVLPLPAESIWDCVEVGRTTVEGIALSELLEAFPGRIDVLKADIEGAEVLALPTLGPADLARIGQLTVEFHGARVFGFGLHRETRRTIRKLRQRGFVALNFAPDHRDVLFINRRMHDVSRPEALRWQIRALRARWRHRLSVLRQMAGSSR
jgi:FkbM family methyltransferase